MLIIQLVICIALIVLVLLQPSKGEGLGAIGGGARMFFSKNKRFEQQMSKATAAVAVAFMVVSLILVTTA